MLETPFIITIDTEGDDLWRKPHEIGTRNVAYLPRFQALCEKFRFPPVYLTNYEMAMSHEFVEFGRDLTARGAGEIGMHLHAWNSPPIEPLTRDDYLHQPYLIEYPDRIMKEKIHVMTQLLESRFGRKMVSHRAGRWAIDARYLAMLREEGYLVDCSVTPVVVWGSNPGDPNGHGGADYTAFPEEPYFPDLADISVAAPMGTLLEVPMTVAKTRPFQWSPMLYRLPVVRRFARRISPERRWLCPVPLFEKRNDKSLLRAARAVRDPVRTHLEFMLHSSELMPGGSPNFRNASDIDRLYEELEALFEELSGWCRGMTLAQFRDCWIGSAARTRAPEPVWQRDDDAPAAPVQALIQ
jgi:hypothetical protein